MTRTSGELHNTTIAILATDGVEEVELTGPREAVEDAGARAVLVTPGGRGIQAYRHDVEAADSFTAEEDLDSCDPADYDGLILPGGTTNPDKLRTHPATSSLIRKFVTSGRPIAAICHGPWSLVEADVLRGKTLTSWPSLQTDIRNAGGTWTDAEVVVCAANHWTLVTSRSPEDLPAFNRAILDEFARSGSRA
ncbi:MAG: type 1 glutamine amidotransferase domain-containing protein [Nocardioides sp.]|uniref:type 1 glutamine amidotransferase domain-containing protein n=1 Tax=Nocardioides sp. TaxID=35761 RepID=UPI0039E6ECE7